MRVLDLFAGIGGFSLGFERAGLKPVAFCEIDPFCRAVLAKHWPDLPVYQDARTLRGEQVLANAGTVELVCAGFPCQPHSVAGHRRGGGDDRDMWPDTMRLVREIRPRWFVGENVPGLLSTIYDNVLLDLEGTGYEVETFLMGADAFGAAHRRQRVWIIAHAAGERMEGMRAARLKISHALDWPLVPIRDSDGQWQVEPDLWRTANGIPGWMDRLRALGNAVVPQIAEAIGRAILEVELERRQFMETAGVL